MMLRAHCLLLLATLAGTATAAGQGSPGGEVTPPVAAAAAPAVERTERIVVLGGALTESLYALGAGELIVAVDDGSADCAPAAELPQLGYLRAISPEGVLSFAPTRVIALDAAGPPATIAALRRSGVPVDILPEVRDIEAAAERLIRLGEILGHPERGRELADAQRRTLAEVLSRVREDFADSAAPRVLFVFARGGGSLHVGGSGTSADAMITLAGGRNAIAELDGHKPLSAEGALLASPEILLVPSSCVKQVGSGEQLLSHPALVRTPAGRTGRLVVVDDLALLGFGPALPNTVAHLAAAFRTHVSDAPADGAAAPQ